MKSIRALCGLLLGSVASFGVVTGVAVNTQVQEAEATPIYSNIYYVGSDNGWADPSGGSFPSGYQFEYAGSKTVGDTTSHYYTLTLDLTRDSKFKIRDWEGGHESDWMASYDGTKVLQGLINDDDGNLKCLMTGNYTITYRWTSSTNRCIEGFELNSATEMFYIADNTTWAASGKIYLHAWGSGGDLTYWGSSCLTNKVPSIKVGSSSLQFYRFKIPTAATAFIIKHYDGNTDYKSGDLTPAGGSCFTSNGTADMGNAGAVIGNIYRHLGNFGSYENSICAIDASTRSYIISAYNSLTNNAKTTFNASKLNTYNPSNLSQKTDVAFSTIITQLQTNTTNGLARSIPSFDNNNNTAIILIVAVSLTALTATSGYLFLRRKRQ